MYENDKELRRVIKSIWPKAADKNLEKSLPKTTVGMWLFLLLMYFVYIKATTFLCFVFEGNKWLISFVDIDDINVVVFCGVCKVWAAGIVGPYHGIMGTQLGIVDTQYGIVGTQYGIVCTQYGIVCTQYGIVCTQYGIVCTQYGIVCTQYGIVYTQYGIV